MVDLNERAFQLAQRNADQQGVYHVEILESDGLSPLEGDLILF